MATECSQDSLDFGTVASRSVVGAFDGGVISSDAGALLLGAVDKAIRLIKRFAACFTDRREAEMTCGPHLNSVRKAGTCPAMPGSGETCKGSRATLYPCRRCPYPGATAPQQMRVTHVREGS